MPVVSKLPIVLAAALAVLALAPAGRAQTQRLPELSQIEPLPSPQNYFPTQDATGFDPYASGQPVAPGQDYFDFDSWMAARSGPTAERGDWFWQLAPDGIIYQAYLANPKESRMGTQIFDLKDDGTVWDSTLGGHIGLIRYGTCDGPWPQGWQLDMEGSVQVRLDPEMSLDVRSMDFRAGAPLTYGYGRHRFKFGYYHLCSHLADEFVLANPGFTRLNFVRDALILGYAIYATDNLRLYAEAGWAFVTDVSEPWEVQFGLDWAPARPTGIRGAPFFAVNAHLREELDFSGNVAAQAGWAWRGERTSHLLRVGLHYYNGASDQFSFYRNFEHQIGAGLWYDF